ncbi:unnamed protein product [Sordaria macrospora k-hell]|uniref:ER membrane protein complex subunit 2 n=1 Tax=Sordaria macrospora (strain ATCC MYA-333 / DSM 997 / K(L3346) / K-hell) TaxID=771870 RepID=F7VTM6_SORMK|nr:uncharacterized protein SMAC_08351 [Sordaria macrospora k-hell]CCC08864.1 unnamed protein product [Sordaria macrospora k-hell]
MWCRRTRVECCLCASRLDAVGFTCHRNTVAGSSFGVQFWKTGSQVPSVAPFPVVVVLSHVTGGIDLCLPALGGVKLVELKDGSYKARFGADNERVMTLRGLMSEAQAQGNGELEAILKQYDAILEGNSTNIPITKRRIALLRSMGRVSDAASALVQLLDFSPTDAEAWSELSDLYFTQGLYSQAIYALEEVLLLTPNAWNIHARLGELQYMAATTSGNGGGSHGKYLAEALKRFARSIELCDDYLRGYYGLKLVTTRLLKEQTKQAKQTHDGEFTLPDFKKIERLDELATAKLSEIVRHSTLKDRGWRGYDEREVAVARELLSQNGIER